MKPQLIHRQRVPYGARFTIDEPSKGIVGSSFNFETLMDRVREYRTANGLPNPPTLESEVEQLVCDKYPSECRETDPTVPTKKKWNWRDVTHGTALMIAHWFAGRPKVSLEEACKRAEVCLKCPYRTEFSRPCSGHCGDLETYVKTVVGSGTTPYDDQLTNQACSICACFVKVSIWVPLELQQRVLDNDQKAQFAKVEHCWKK